MRTILNLATAACLLAPTPAHSAIQTVVHGTTFEIVGRLVIDFAGLNLDPNQLQSRARIERATSAAPRFLSPFDPSLGTLKAVTVDLRSQMKISAGASVELAPGARGSALFQTSPSFGASLGLAGTSFAEATARLPDPMPDCLATFDGQRSCMSPGPITFVRLDRSATLLPDAFIDQAVLLDLQTVMALDYYLLRFAEIKLGFVSEQVWSGDLTLTYAYDDGVTAVPEPASWALLIGGFAATGIAARRQRSPLAA